MNARLQVVDQGGDVCEQAISLLQPCQVSRPTESPYTWFIKGSAQSGKTKMLMIWWIFLLSFRSNLSNISILRKWDGFHAILSSILTHSKLSHFFHWSIQVIFIPPDPQCRPVGRMVHGLPRAELQHCLQEVGLLYHPILSHSKEIKTDPKDDNNNFVWRT